MFDRRFRVSETGRYRDYVAIGEADQSRSPSSTAATGIGLIALAIGDALGVVEYAEAKAALTLAHLLDDADEGGFAVARSPSGWFPHFVDPLTGRAAAESKFDEAGAFEAAGYGVSTREKNKRDTASPAIMAGLAALHDYGEAGDPLEDLQTLWREETCRYQHEGPRCLWRCSARDPSLKVRLVEAVDFSAYLLGLAARDARFGMGFFRDFTL